jgi:hypothetical protein
MSNQKIGGIIGFIISFIIVYCITSSKMNYWKPDSLNVIYGLLAALYGGVVGQFLMKEK